MNEEEMTILNFLKASPEARFARREIARRAGSRSLFEENPRWIDAPLAALTGQGLVEITIDGFYQFKRRVI